MKDCTAEEQRKRLAQDHKIGLGLWCMKCELPLGQGDCPRCASLEIIEKRGGPMVMA